VNVVLDLCLDIIVRVVDIFSLKPLDRDGLRTHIEECGGIVVVVEDHYEAGGAYEAICGAMPTSIKRIKHLCVMKVPGSAKPSEQLEIHGIDSKSIATSARQLLSV
jgi:transketolase